MAKKTDDELSSILKRPEDWTPEAFEVARAELRRRGIDPDSIKPPPTDIVTDEPPDEPQAGEEEEKEEEIGEIAKKKINFQQQAYIGIGTSFGLDFVARMVFASSTPDNFLGVAIGVISLCFFIWGCAGYAEGNGYPKWLGGLGLFCCIGLVILILLPDRRKGFDDHES